jgi:hypothetical protein
VGKHGLNGAACTSKKQSDPATIHKIASMHDADLLGMFTKP